MSDSQTRFTKEVVRRVLKQESGHPARRARPNRRNAFNAFCVVLPLTYVSGHRCAGNSEGAHSAVKTRCGLYACVGDLTADCTRVW
eukprot:4843945-Pyramimonas_sp.AAC.5